MLYCRFLSMDEENDPILCFQHCCDSNILCLRLPDQCPICLQSLASTSLKIPPFRLPTPFVNSKDHPFALVIKPTLGSFLDSSSSVLTDDLHVGVSDSDGKVYDFDEDGINRSVNGWNQCLAVSVTNKAEYKLTALWNAKLQEFISSTHWIAEKYDEQNHNCLSFAVEFMCYMGLDKNINSLKDKTSFCRDILLPKSKEAIKYVQIYEKLCTEGGIIVEKSVVDTRL